MKTVVYNLANDTELTFIGVSPVNAVCYAYAEDSNQLSQFYSAVQRGVDLARLYPVVFGTTSVACGDFVAAV